MDNETNDTDSIDPIQRNITITVLVIFAFPGLLCFLFIFYHAIKLRKRLVFDTINNHVIFLILICDFLAIATDLPIMLYYFGYGNIYTINICVFWIYWNYSLPVTSLLITTYASIERYILVFHRHTAQRHKFLLHYIPMLCFTIYIPILYFALIVFVPCPPDFTYDTREPSCNGACYTTYVWLNTFDIMCNQTLPCVILLVFNALIIVRVIISRTAALGSAPLRNILKKNRRLILQLLGVSSMSLLAWLPWLVINIQGYFYVPEFEDWFMTYILLYLPYITASISPFLALIGLPEIRRQFITGRFETQVVPYTFR